MITVPITVNYLVDEVAQIGVLDGKYARFEANIYVAPIDVNEAVDKYIEIGARVPDEFVAVREIVSQKLARLQALL